MNLAQPPPESLVCGAPTSGTFLSPIYILLRQSRLQSLMLLAPEQDLWEDSIRLQRSITNRTLQVWDCPLAPEPGVIAR